MVAWQQAVDTANAEARGLRDLLKQRNDEYDVVHKALGDERQAHAQTKRALEEASKEAARLQVEVDDLRDDRMSLVRWALPTKKQAMAAYSDHAHGHEGGIQAVLDLCAKSICASPATSLPSRQDVLQAFYKAGNGVAEKARDDGTSITEQECMDAGVDAVYDLFRQNALPQALDQMVALKRLVLIVSRLAAPFESNEFGSALATRQNALKEIHALMRDLGMEQP